MNYLSSLILFTFFLVAAPKAALAEDLQPRPFTKCEDAPLNEILNVEQLNCTDCDCYNKVFDGAINNLANDQKEKLSSEMKGFYQVVGKNLINDIVQVANDFEKLGVDFSKNPEVAKSCRFDKLLENASCDSKEANNAAKELLKHFDDVSMPGFVNQSANSCLSTYEVHGMKEVQVQKDAKAYLEKNFAKLFYSETSKYKEVLSNSKDKSLYNLISEIYKNETNKMQRVKLKLILNNINKLPSVKLLMQEAGSVSEFSNVLAAGEQLSENVISKVASAESNQKRITNSLKKKCDQLFEKFDQVYCKKPGTPLSYENKLNENLLKYKSKFVDVNAIEPLDIDNDHTGHLENQLFYCRAHKCESLKEDSTKDGYCFRGNDEDTYNPDELFNYLSNGLPDMMLTSNDANKDDLRADKANYDAKICPLLMCEKIADAEAMVNQTASSCSPELKKKRTMASLLKSLDCENNKSGLCDNEVLKQYLDFYKENQIAFEESERQADITFAIQNGEEIDFDIEGPSSFLSSFRGEVGRRVDAGKPIFVKEEIEANQTAVAQEDSSTDTTTVPTTKYVSKPSVKKATRDRNVSPTNTEITQLAGSGSQNKPYNPTQAPTNYQAVSGSGSDSSSSEIDRVKKDLQTAKEKAAALKALNAVNEARAALNEANSVIDNNGPGESQIDQSFFDPTTTNVTDGGFTGIAVDPDTSGKKPASYGEDQNYVQPDALADDQKTRPNGEDGDSSETSDDEDEGSQVSQSEGADSSDVQGSKGGIGLSSGDQFLEVAEPELASLTEEALEKSGINPEEEFIIKVNIGDEVYEVKVLEVSKDGEKFLEPQVDDFPLAIRKKILRSPVFEKAYLKHKDRLAVPDLSEKLKEITD